MGQSTEAKLTENDGPYVEIMTGAFSDNQPDYSWIKPYEVKTFRQYWYPVKDIKGFKNANLNGALNFEKQGTDKIFIGFCSTQKFNKIKIRLLKSGKPLFEKISEISPGQSITQVITIPGPFKETDLSAEVLNEETGNALISYRPADRPAVDKLPETVKAPPKPQEIKTAEELYLTGSRIQQFYNPSIDAMDYFREALRLDPGDTRTNIAVGNIFLKNGDYEKARNYFLTAIQRLTKDYTRPSGCEALYLEGITLKSLGLYEEAIDTLYRATWDYAWNSAAYLELARISAIKGDFRKALEQVERSLSTNSVNNSAICLKASLLRRLNLTDEAANMLQNTCKYDPLDFRAANEIYLLELATDKIREAEEQLKVLGRRMRDFDRNYLELATGYMNDGLFIEAEEVLRRFQGKNPIVDYCIGYLQDRKGEKAKASEYFNKASGMPVDYVFPYMMETIPVLEKALEYNPQDSRAYYYLGNILYDHQPEKAIKYWEKAVEGDPGFAIAYRNLGWGYFYHYGDGVKAIGEYEKAMVIDKSEPLWYKELDALYEISNAPIEKRMKLFEGSNEIVKKRDDAFLHQVIVMTLAGRPDKAVEYLEGRNFSYREGESDVRNVIIDAHLMLGRKYFSEKYYNKALEQFLLAQVPEEEAGDNSSQNRKFQVDWYIGQAYEAIGNKTLAKNYYLLSAGNQDSSSDYTGYYTGLSNLKLKNKSRAEQIFNSMIETGEKEINNPVPSSLNYFAKFGAREADNKRLSNAYLVAGLGYKGAGIMNKAKEYLHKATELSKANLWAESELEGI